MPQSENKTRPLRFVHIGDMHLTVAGENNHRDLQAIVAEANANLAGLIDFSVCPGDIAEDGTAAQFALAAAALADLKMPWRAIPGDHDFKPKSLAAFYGTLKAKPLPFAETIAGVRCLYLDIVSAGRGGPDFRLSDDTVTWLRSECEAMKTAGQKGVAFLHAYPADFGAGGETVAAILDSSPVVLVDTGHTHYNELCHDGRTIYAATRSVGQLEEGEVGYALACVDDGAVSWRFKPLGSSWPFVMITSPADRRVSFDNPFAERSGKSLPVRAATFGASPIRRAECRIDHGSWQSMRPDGDGLFHIDSTIAATDVATTLSVRVVAEDGCEDTDTIEITSKQTQRQSSGGDAGSIGEWSSRHLLGTQLGPNRNGRKW